MSECLRLADCRLFNHMQSSSHCLSHLLLPEKHHLRLQYVLEVTVTLSTFAQTSFANPLLYHEVYFLSFDFFSFTVFIYSVLHHCIASAFVICLIKRYNFQTARTDCSCRFSCRPHSLELSPGFRLGPDRQFGLFQTAV